MKTPNPMSDVKKYPIMPFDLESARKSEGGNTTF